MEERYDMIIFNIMTKKFKKEKKGKTRRSLKFKSQNVKFALKKFFEKDFLLANYFQILEDFCGKFQDIKIE